MRPILFALLCSLALGVFASPVPHVVRAKSGGSRSPSPGATTPKTAPCEFAVAVHDRGKLLATGTKGIVYDVQKLYKNQKAVVKVIPENWARSTPKEAQNLAAVGQLLDWGYKEDGKEKTHYLLMKNMGIPFSEVKPKLSEADGNTLIMAALERYKKEFQMTNNDKNPGNFLFRQVGGKWQAEIVDWEKGVWEGKSAAPAAPAPKKVANPQHCVVQ
ncbi:hypothetical protein D9615_006125 [Tricholomella constricta]|uniref:Uncharacterized protein n=1 Tax=Tricholomella constricta TaxID=117010 RepID=A0A8H5HB92_9AGAR|nr:hypothetical protein D9615_006125 [Tricholomella constricta]